jgi:glycosyltransferase involved in cell wall biosynthesis
MMGQSRKVLVLTHIYPRWEGDDAGVFLKELVEQFCARQINVCVIAPHFAGVPTIERADYLEIHRFRYAPAKAETFAYAGNMHKQVMRPLGLLKFLLFMISYACKAVELVNREKPDVVFAQWLIPSGIVGWFVSVFRGKKLYVTSHGADIVLLKKSGLLRSLARLIYRRCTKAFVVSNYLRETALDLDLTTPAKIEVCPMPARTDLFGKQPVLERIPPLILAVARFTHQKQLEVLIKALGMLRDDDIDFVCEIYGEGEREAELLTLIAESSLQERVLLKAPVPQAQLAKIYPSARVTVLPSINEGFGMTLVEAKLSGSAVIGARSGGILDIIHDRETGLLFEPGNAEQLAAQIRSILSDEQLYRNLITNAKKDAEKRFSPDVIAAQYEQALGLALRE